MLRVQQARRTFSNGNGERRRYCVAQAAKADGSSGGPGSSQLPKAPPKEASVAFDSTALPQNFCIIEDKATVQDFAKLQLQEIKEAVQVRVRELNTCYDTHISRRLPASSVPFCPGE